MNTLQIQSAAEYRPEVGQTLFISFDGNQPFLATITAFRAGKTPREDQFEYFRARKSAVRSEHHSFSGTTFHRDAPTDAAFIYVVQLEENEFMESSTLVDEGYFFDPQSAFEYLDAIEAGRVTPRYKQTAEFGGYSVRVERI